MRDGFGTRSGFATAWSCHGQTKVTQIGREGGGGAFKRASTFNAFARAFDTRGEWLRTKGQISHINTHIVQYIHLYVHWVHIYLGLKRSGRCAKDRGVPECKVILQTNGSPLRALCVRVLVMRAPADHSAHIFLTHIWRSRTMNT